MIATPMAWIAPLSVALGLSLGPAGPSTQTLRLQVPTEVSGPDQTVLRRRFDDGVARSGFNSKPASAKVEACSDADCRRTAAERSGVEFYLGGTIRRSGPDWQVEVYAISGSTGDVVAQVDGVCEICGIGELGDVVGALAARLRPALENNIQPTALVVDSDPDGAEVWVDGEQVGTTPLNTNVPAGDHQVDVIKRGRRTEHVEFTAKPGVNESYSFRLARTTAIPPWVPWTALGVGVGSLGVGIGLLVVDENPIDRDCNPDASGNCEFLYDTVNGGVVLTVVGVALVGTGVGLLINQRQKDRVQRSGVAKRVRLVPGIGGASLVGRF